MRILMRSKGTMWRDYTARIRPIMLLFPHVRTHFCGQWSRSRHCEDQREKGQATPGLFLRRHSRPPPAYLDAVGSGTGLSDSVCRYAMTSARSLSFGMPAKPIAVPGTNPFGLVRNWLRSSSVQVPPLAFIAAEKLNPRPSPLWSPTTPQRFGPTRFGSPFAKVWQARRLLAAG